MNDGCTFLKCPHCCLAIVVNSNILEYFQGSLSQPSLHLTLLLIYPLLCCFLFINFYFMWLLLQVNSSSISQVMTSSYARCPFFLSRFSCDDTPVEVSVQTVLQLSDAISRWDLSYVKHFSYLSMLSCSFIADYCIFPHFELLKYL